MSTLADANPNQIATKMLPALFMRLGILQA